MSEVVMETICSRCINREICKYLEEVLDLYKRVARIDIDVSKPYGIQIWCEYQEE